MASAHIEINGTGSRLNRDLREFVNNLQAVVNEAERLKGIFDQAALGADWAGMATVIGLDPVEEVTKAEAIYNIHGSVVTELNGTFITQMLQRLG